jgi:hypothetical protein
MWWLCMLFPPIPFDFELCIALSIMPLPPLPFFPDDDALFADFVLREDDRLDFFVFLLDLELLSLEE